MDENQVTEAEATPEKVYNIRLVSDETTSSDVLSAILGLGIVLLIIGVVVFQHWQYDKLRFSQCTNEIVSPVGR